MSDSGASRALIRYFGSFVLVLNIAVAGLSLSDMYLLASGAVKVELPTEKDFSWHFDAGQSAIVFTGSYIVQNRGFYDITDLRIDASVRSAGGARLVEYGESGLRIPSFGGGRYPIVAEMPIGRLLDLEYGSMLFNGTHFRIHVKISACYILGMARFHSDETMDYPWTPPLQSFTGLFRNGSLLAMLEAALPPLEEAAISVRSAVASAILAGGESVTMHAANADFCFRYHDDRLDIRVIAPGPVPLELFRISLKLPPEGDGDGRSTL